MRVRVAWLTAAAVSATAITRPMLPDDVAARGELSPLAAYLPSGTYL